LPRTIKRQTSTNNEREELREQLELVMSTLRSSDNREGSATADHLENLINHAGIDAVARAIDRIVRELSNRNQRERDEIGRVMRVGE
jgi:tRNA C32,U32 (ribose-2'-O)-methylase TrmJ